VKDASFFAVVSLLVLLVNLNRIDIVTGWHGSSPRRLRHWSVMHVTHALRLKGGERRHTRQKDLTVVSQHTGVPSHPLEGMALPKGPKSFGCSSVFEA